MSLRVVSTLVVAVVLSAASTAAAQQNAPTYSKDVAPILWNALSEQDWGHKANDLLRLSDEMWFVDRPELVGMLGDLVN